MPQRHFRWEGWWRQLCPAHMHTCSRTFWNRHLRKKIICCTSLKKKCAVYYCIIIYNWSLPEPSCQGHDWPWPTHYLKHGQNVGGGVPGRAWKVNFSHFDKACQQSISKSIALDRFAAWQRTKNIEGQLAEAIQDREPVTSLADFSVLQISQLTWFQMVFPVQLSLWRCLMFYLKRHHARYDMFGLQDGHQVPLTPVVTRVSRWPSPSSLWVAQASLVQSWSKP